MQKTRVAYLVIVLNYKTNEDTRAAVQSVLQHSSDAMHIIVVDVQQKSRLTFNSDKVTVLHTDENRGYAFGNNMGIRYGLQYFKSDYVFIMNPYVLLIEDDTCERLIAEVKQRKVENPQLVGGQPLVVTGNTHEPLYQVNIRSVYNYLDVLIDSFYPLRQLFKHRYEKMRFLQEAPYQRGVYYHVPAGSFFFIESDYFGMTLQGFDESTFLYEEEMMLGYRLMKDGHQLYFQPWVRVLHEQGKSTQSHLTLTKFAYTAMRNSRKHYLERYLKCNRLATSFALLLFSVNYHCKRLIDGMGSRK